MINQLCIGRYPGFASTILARFIHKIVVKADGIEVHYHTSIPSAFYVSLNIKLDVPRTHR